MRVPTMPISIDDEQGLGVEGEATFAQCFERSGDGAAVGSPSASATSAAFPVGAANQTCSMPPLFGARRRAFSEVVLPAPAGAEST